MLVGVQTPPVSSKIKWNHEESRQCYSNSEDQISDYIYLQAHSD
jgi:hypothetical protein